MLFLRRIFSFITSVIAVFTALFSGELEPHKNNYIYLHVPYGAEERQLVDIYIPRAAEGDKGLVLFIHGGAWIAGNKDGSKDSLIEWSGRGYVAAALNYHYIDENTHINTLMDDITLALETIKTRAAKRGVNVEKALLVGYSAGSHMAMLYAYAHADEAPIKPAAVFSRVGPAMLWDEDFIFNNAMGDADYMAKLTSDLSGFLFTPDAFADAIPALESVSPVTYVTKNAVPTLMAYGALDTVVHAAQTNELDKRLTACGVPHDFILFPNSGHALENDPECAARADALFLQYAQTYLN